MFYGFFYSRIDKIENNFAMLIEYLTATTCMTPKQATAILNGRDALFDN